MVVAIPRVDLIDMIGCTFLIMGLFSGATYLCVVYGNIMADKWKTGEQKKHDAKDLESQVKSSTS
jgi:hypothetical protein